MLLPKGWFRIDGVQRGDRTLADQLKGLEPLLALHLSGKRILDLGCAEGLLAEALVARGAAHVRGVEVVAAAAKHARSLAAKHDGRMSVLHWDLNDPLPEPLGQWDVVLMLAILHKLRNPFALLEQVACMSPALCVARLPGDSDGIIMDPRSNLVPYDVPAWFERRGYELSRVTRGHFNEWCGHFIPRR